MAKNALTQRTLDPMRNYFKKIPAYMAYPQGKWATGDDNWNTACWNGVLLTALTQISDQKERDDFLNIAIENTTTFFNAFQEDGYYTESINSYFKIKT